METNKILIKRMENDSILIKEWIKTIFEPYKSVYSDEFLMFILGQTMSKFIKGYWMNISDEHFKYMDEIENHFKWSMIDLKKIKIYNI